MTKRFLLGTLAALLIGCTVGWANTITYVTPSGSTDTAGDGVSAQAVVTTGAGTVTIALSNLTGSFKDAGQLLSDFEITLSNGTVSSAAYAAGTSGSGNLIFVGTAGAITPDGSTTTAGWGLSTAGQTITLNGLGGTNTPKELVIGAPCTTGMYCDANGSIANNPGHNPFINSPLTFTIDVTGVTSSTTTSGSVFSFGTAGGDNVPGTPMTPAAEPSSAMLAGMVLLGFMGLALFQRRKQLA